MHTNARVDVLRTTGVVVVKVWFIPSQVDSSKWNFEYMTGLFMSNFPVWQIMHQFIANKTQNISECKQEFGNQTSQNENKN